jgi:hypothetical protein
MRFVGRVFSPIAGGILVVMASHVSQSADADHTATAVAAGNVGGQGVRGLPQKDGTVKGSPKPNSSINGSQPRAKH